MCACVCIVIGDACVCRCMRELYITVCTLCIYNNYNTLLINTIDMYLLIQLICMMCACACIVIGDACVCRCMCKLYITVCTLCINGACMCVYSEACVCKCVHKLYYGVCMLCIYTFKKLHNQPQKGPNFIGINSSSPFPFPPTTLKAFPQLLFLAMASTPHISSFLLNFSSNRLATSHFNF